ncbi:cyd operon YbgE family protein [Aliivibrio logei]|uniref:Cytochrome bd biosynthesis protein n=2 Tax=Aliivibrio logei TaxID=688 RepID=A0A1B9P1F1_ALILO|nr:cyd operon YbgE family protein [Aliivibrio logei]OCH22189.1 cytochrome bd biosynthesis protein [Aliivibrio logei]OEF10925.1 cytochrome bd biosynthesis protein [Aliivibrio logei 5S-186]
MSNIAGKIDSVHSPINNIIVKLILIGAALFHMGMLMWEPTVYSENIGGFSGLMAPALIYAVCTAFIFVVGFIPQKWGWKLLFSPYFSMMILSYFSYLYFI